jgi:hypothetical protein
MKGDMGGKRGGAYGHSEDGVGGLEAVGPLLPEVPLIGALDSGDIAAGASAGLRDKHVADTVPRGHRHTLPRRGRAMVRGARSGGAGAVAAMATISGVVVLLGDGLGTRRSG